MTTTCLELRKLRKNFGGLTVTADLSMRVEAGERRLLLGPNGAGKTTLFNQIAGDLRHDAGEILLFGRPIGHLRADQRAQIGVARTFQIITLFGRDTLAHNVALALLGKSGARWNPLTPMRSDRKLWAEAHDALDRVGLGDLADRPLAETSYGERRRLEIAMALVQKPRLLLLDGPLAGLSREERKTAETVIRSIPRDVTVLLIEHDMDVALDLADRITVLHYGSLVVEGDREAVVADPRVKEVYLGH